MLEITFSPRAESPAAAVVRRVTDIVVGPREPRALPCGGWDLGLGWLLRASPTCWRLRTPLTSTQRTESRALKRYLSFALGADQQEVTLALEPEDLPRLAVLSARLAARADPVTFFPMRDRLVVEGNPARLAEALVEPGDPPIPDALRDFAREVSSRVRRAATAPVLVAGPA